MSRIAASAKPSPLTTGTTGALDPRMVTHSVEPDCVWVANEPARLTPPYDHAEVSERRRGARAPLSVGILVTTAEIATAVDAEVLDVSQGGMRLRLALPHTSGLGDRITFDVTPRGAARRTLTGEIVNMDWTDGPSELELGLRWIEPHSDALDTLRDRLAGTHWRAR